MFDGLTAAFWKRLVFDTALPSCPPAPIQFGKSSWAMQFVSVGI
jgi:hypothetical protein